LCTSVDLGTGYDTSIRVTYDNERLDFLSDFAGSCFRSGLFRSQTGAANTWVLDCRAGLGEGTYTRAIASELVSGAGDVAQFVGSGFGAYMLIGAILGVHGKDVRGALLRPARKAYGRKQLIEGTLCPHKPVCVVDDVLNSGESACRVVGALRDEGFQNISCACIFRYRWGTGVAQLADRQVECRWLADVTQLKQTEHSRPVSPALIRSWQFLLSQRGRLRRLFRT
jgi:orotate phosphoribosyltransferase